MRILVYGAGAVGLGIASCLLKSGENVEIIARKDTVSALSKGGLKRKGIFGEFYAPPEAFGSFSKLNDLSLKPYDYFLITTKSFDSSQAAKDISVHNKLLNNKSKIVLFQNGWGNAEIFTSFFPKKKIYNARVITGFCRPEKNIVTVTVHAEPIHIGSLFTGSLKDVQYLCKAIRKGGIPCEAFKDIEKDLWAKMLYNCALNSLGAVFNVPYGVLGEWEYTQKIMDDITEEIFEVIRKSGHNTHWKNAEGFLKVFYDKLLPATYKHESSTLQDIRAKKNTEIDALNGAVIQLAKKAKVKVPYNTIVYNMVKFLEARSHA